MIIEALLIVGTVLSRALFVEAFEWLLGLSVGGVLFILAGFEHSIADMFYAVMAGQIKEMLLPILIITLGNAIGGNLIPLVLRMTKD